MTRLEQCRIVARGLAFVLGMSTFTVAAVDDDRTQLAEETIETTVTPSVEADPTDVEEVIVRGEDPFARTSREFEVTIRAVYHSNALGERYYRLREYRKAFPYLEHAAMNGFKLAQARLGFIFMHGMNVVERDPETAIGWLGVAAEEPTHPEIRNYFKMIWSNVPDFWENYLTQVVDAYVATYGQEAKGVQCEMRRKAGTHISRFGCFFDAEIDFLQQDMQSQGGAESPFLPAPDLPTNQTGP